MATGGNCRLLLAGLVRGVWNVQFGPAGWSVAGGGIGNTAITRRLFQFHGAVWCLHRSGKGAALVMRGMRQCCSRRSIAARNLMYDRCR